MGFAHHNMQLRRLRLTQSMRDLVQEHRLSKTQLVQPVFVEEGLTQAQPIPGLFEQSRHTIDDLPAYAQRIQAAGIQTILLFPIPQADKKDPSGNAALDPKGIAAQAIVAIKKAAPDLIVMVDLCFCAFTDHGHCGVQKSLGAQVILDNQATLSQLALQACMLAEAGADVVAPSGMVDGMVAVIRDALDAAGYDHVVILSYAVKYKSHFYGPFRAASGGTPQSSDRANHQMHYANGAEALAEVALDIDEGADCVMVKPGHTYLDILYRVKEAYPEVPLAVYHVSGECAMIEGVVGDDKAMRMAMVDEVLHAFVRAGARFIITYYALMWAESSSS
jgi:porphobilinogen synthase